LTQHFLHVLLGKKFYCRPNRPRDLNFVLSSIERCSVDSPATGDRRAVLLEGAHRAVTLVPTMRNPLNVLAKGLIATIDRGDKTAIELFLDGANHLSRALA
jgi:hypothetical protein